MSSPQGPSAADRSITDELRAFFGALRCEQSRSMVGGVAAGIATALAVDVVLVRIVLFVAMMMAFPVVVAYLLAWFMLRNAETSPPVRPPTPAQRRLRLRAVGAMVLIPVAFSVVSSVDEGLNIGWPLFMVMAAALLLLSKRAWSKKRARSMPMGDWVTGAGDPWGAGQLPPSPWYAARVPNTQWSSQHGQQGQSGWPAAAAPGSAPGWGAGHVAGRPSPGYRPVGGVAGMAQQTATAPIPVPPSSQVSPRTRVAGQESSDWRGVVIPVETSTPGPPWPAPQPITAPSGVEMRPNDLLRGLSGLDPVMPSAAGPAVFSPPPTAPSAPMPITSPSKVRTRRSHRPFWMSMSVLALAGGVLAVLHQAGLGIGASTVMGVLLALTGLCLVLASRRGSRARGLIAVGLAVVLSMVSLATYRTDSRVPSISQHDGYTVIGSTAYFGSESVVVNPQRIQDVHERYMAGSGHLTLDLSGVDFSNSSSEIRVVSSDGGVTLVLPRNIPVVVKTLHSSGQLRFTPNDNVARLDNTTWRLSPLTPPDTTPTDPYSGNAPGSDPEPPVQDPAPGGSQAGTDELTVHITMSSADVQVKR